MFSFPAAPHLSLILQQILVQKNCATTKGHISARTKINKHILYSDLREMEVGIWKAMTVPGLPDAMPAVDHIITYILIDGSKERGHQQRHFILAELGRLSPDMFICACCALRNLWKILLQDRDAGWVRGEQVIFCSQLFAGD